jgi:aspartate aminotransferase-like enzyme
MLIADEPDKLLMIPGPTPVLREILAALGEPTVSHTSAYLAGIIRACQDGIRVVAGTQEAAVFIFGGSGTLAQEAAIANLLAPGERLLVVSNGVFGDRFAPMAEAHGVQATTLQAEWGTSVTAEVLAGELASGSYQAVTLTHVETSTGVMAPIEEMARVARDHGALVILDAVCSLAGTPVEMDAWGLDIVLSGAQKALGVPPGLSILAASPAAMERRRARERVSTYYADFLNWEPAMLDPRVYFSTHAVNLFYALKTALDAVLAEGLEPRFARHCNLACSFRAGTAALGLASLTEERFLAPTMSVVAYPDGLDDARFLPALSEDGVVAAGCLGALRGKGARFGHMGNITHDEVLRTVAAVERVLIASGLEIEPGTGLTAASSAISTPA